MWAPTPCSPSAWSRAIALHGGAPGVISGGQRRRPCSCRNIISRRSVSPRPLPGLSGMGGTHSFCLPRRATVLGGGRGWPSSRGPTWASASRTSVRLRLSPRASWPPPSSRPGTGAAPWCAHTSRMARACPPLTFATSGPSGAACNHRATTSPASRVGTGRPRPR